MEGQPTGTRSLSLVIPAYNEAAVIRQAIAEADEALARLGGDYEILVVDDGSTDNTTALVKEAAQGRPHVRLLVHPRNRGYGAALRTGFEAARHDYVAFTDADCQFDLNDLACLLPLSERCPVVVGYRRHRQDPALRRFVSWGYNQVVRTLLGTRVRDCDCALKVFRRDALVHLLPETGGFFVNTEILTRARQLDYEIAEVGVRHRPRQGGASKVSLGDVPRILKTLVPFWWTRVLFPGTGPAEGASAPSRTPVLKELLQWAVMLLVAGLLFFTRLNCPLLEPEEARYAEIPRQMLEEHRIAIPVLHGQPYLQKPPLLYWLVMASYRLFGIHDWAARLVPCTASFLIVVSAYLWGRRMAGAQAGFTGAMILCLSARFIYFGRMLTFDSLLCLWVISALAAAHGAIGNGKVRWGRWLLSAGFCGLGLLTKGPVALALVGLPVVAYQMLDQRAARPTFRCWLIYGVLAAGIACPWYIAAAAGDLGFPAAFFWTHNVVRYFAPFDHEKPVWFYLPGLLLGMLPWTLLLVPLLSFLGGRSFSIARHRSPALGFYLLAALVSLIFFSISGCKRAGYILPVLPPLALALGCYLTSGVPWAVVACRIGSAELTRRFGRLPFGANLLVLALGCGGSIVTLAFGLWKLGPALAFGGLMAAAFVLLLRYRRTWAPQTSWALCAGTTFVLLFTAVHQLLPGYARKFSLRGEVRRHFLIASQAHVPVACYPHRWDSVGFYLGRRDVQVYTPERHQEMIADLKKQKDTLIFVKAGRSLEQFLRRLPHSLKFLPRGRRGMVVAAVIRQK
jgi:dolichol-phosphate mannosyltransferase